MMTPTQAEFRVGMKRVAADGPELTLTEFFFSFGQGFLWKKSLTADGPELTL